MPFVYTLTAANQHAAMRRVLEPFQHTPVLAFVEATVIMLTEGTPQGPSAERNTQDKTIQDRQVNPVDLDRDGHPFAQKQNP